MEEKLKVLVIEDDEVDRMSIRRLLHSSNLDVKIEEAEFIKEALQKLKGSSYHCILLDNGLPDGTGIDFLDQLSSENKAPIIILTGGGDELLAVQLLKSGAADYIRKDQMSSNVLEGSILRAVKFFDLEERSRLAEEELIKREAEFRTILAAVPDIILKMDSSQNITFINQAVNFLGFEPEHLMGKSIKQLLGPDTNNDLLPQLTTKRIGPRSTSNLEISFYVNKKSMFYSSMKSVQVLIDSKGLWSVPDEEVLQKDNEKQFLGTLLIAKNLTEQKKVENELRESQTKLKESNAILEKLSNQDGLTGIANRYCFDQFIAREVKRAHRDKTIISLVMIDIDFFKKFNDRYGHQAGDECLKKVAKVLNDSLKRPSDLVARFGGEEFAVVLPGADSLGASTFAERVRVAIEDVAIKHEDNEASENVTISLGFYTANSGENATPEIMIKNADVALYKAKNDGRNRSANGNLKV